MGIEFSTSAGSVNYISYADLGRASEIMDYFQQRAFGVRFGLMGIVAMSARNLSEKGKYFSACIKPDVCIHNTCVLEIM